MSIPNPFLRSLNCAGCSARPLYDGFHRQSKENERMRANELQAMGVPRVLLLCESAPRTRFVYDRRSNYLQNGLRYNLRQELTPAKTDQALFAHLRDQRVWVVDCALCPINQLSTNAQERHAATYCLSRHARLYLDTFPSAKVISIFPSHRGFLKLQLPDVARRNDRPFPFGNLSGLKAAKERGK